QADVGQQQQGQGGERAGADGGPEALPGEETAVVGIPSVLLRQRGLLDAYA
ncbi:MAG TPA: flagellar hook-length control protein FliK, partial [Xanthomonadaceae bacterium]|nr:flagellar hook-length control protein FliK [Xanthomonadaceae bacterium]